MTVEIPPGLHNTFRTMVCRCNRIYFVFKDSSEEATRSLHELADTLKAILVSEEGILIFKCKCGRALDFADQSSEMVQ